MDPYRCGDPLYLEGAEIGELEVAVHQPRGVLGHEHLARLGQRLHARRQADRVADGRVLEALVVADGARDDLARVDSHAHQEAQALRAAQLARVGGELVAQVQRGQARPACVVLVRDRGAEQGHDPVAGELVDRPFVAVDAFAEDREEPVHDPPPLLRIQRGGEVHRLLDVGEQDRDLLALAARGPACGFAGPLIGAGLTRCQPVAALLAEASGGRAFVTAGRAAHEASPPRAGSRAGTSGLVPARNPA